MTCCVNGLQRLKNKLNPLLNHFKKVSLNLKSNGVLSTQGRGQDWQRT